MRLVPPHPVDATRTSRYARLTRELPPAGNLLRRVQNHIEPFKHGIAIEGIDSQYTFIPEVDASGFFRMYLSQGFDTEVDEEQILNHVARTLNVFSENIAAPDVASRHFQAIMRDTILPEIEEANSLQAPFVSVIVGPTGCGKTAFSKGLFTASLREMWARRMIPTRVEYSRFFNHTSEVSVELLSRYIAQCQLRDALIWYFFEKRSRGDKYLEGIRELDETPSIRKKFEILREESRGKQVDGVDYTLQDAHRLWSRTVGYGIPHDLAESIVDALVLEYDLRFLVSLDGFDAIRPGDFAVSADHTNPVTVVAEFLNRALGKCFEYVTGLTPLSTNFIIYIRDTTYFRLRLEFQYRVSGKVPIQPRWIVPPGYVDLVRIMARRLDIEVTRGAGRAQIESFSSHLEALFRRCFGEYFPAGSRSGAISTIFGWNARNMKRHVGRMLSWSLDNIVQNEPELVAKAGRAGINEKWLWERCILNNELAAMPDYLLHESLFLDESRQLKPQFRVSQRDVSDALRQRRLREALYHLGDYGEMIGFIDCIFDYLTGGGTVYSGSEKMPHLLIFVRTCQFLRYQGSSQPARIHSFLCDIGYEVDLTTVEFVICILLRNEFISSKIAEGDASIQDCRFDLTISGRIVLDRILHTLTYFSECLLISYLPDEGIARELKGRRFVGNKDWVLDCVFNSIAGLQIIRAIEEIESSFADSAKISFDRYRLYNDLKDDFSREADRIIGSQRGSFGRALLQLRADVISLKSKFDEVDIFEHLERNMGS